MRQHLFILAIVVVLCAGCSGSESDPVADEQPVASATVSSASSPAAEEPPAATATPPPASSSAAMPALEPIFVRAEMPASSVSSPARAIFGIADATDELPMVGVGYRDDGRTGLAAPIVWSFASDTKPEFDDLPLAPDAISGRAFRADAALGGQLAVGRIIRNQLRTAVYWFRGETGEWSISDFPPALIPPENGESYAISVAGSETWALVQVIVESPTEVDDEGDPILSQHIFASDMVGEWQRVEMPGVNPEDWFFASYIDGDNGFIAARLDDDENPASKYFITADAGATWAAHDVGIIDGQIAYVGDVLWDGGDLLVFGGVGVTGEADPAIFVVEDDGIWRPQVVEFGGRDSTQIADATFQAVVRLDASTFLAVVDADSGNATVVSTDGSTWELDATYDLNSTNNSSSDFREFGYDADRGRFLAARGFGAPVWLDQNGVEVTASIHFDRTFRELKGVVGHDVEFVAISGQIGEEAGVALWSSPDGSQWDSNGSDPAHVPKRLTDVGDAIFSYGLSEQGGAMFRVYEGGADRLNSSEFFSFGQGDQILVPRTARAWGRNLIVTQASNSDGSSTSESRIIAGFVDISEPGQQSMHIVDVPGDSVVDAVCPQLRGGEIAVLVREADSIGQSIEVWTDRAEPRLGSGELASDSGKFANTAMVDCEAMNDGLITTGANCSVNAMSESVVGSDVCQGAIWVSDDALGWALHPQNDALARAEIFFTQAVVSLGPGALVVGVPADSADDRSLWLVTNDDILRVPIEEVLSLTTGADIQWVAATDTHVAFATRSEIFAGTIQQLIERTLGDADAVDAWNQQAAALQTLPEPTVAPTPPASATTEPAPTRVAAAPPLAVPTAPPATAGTPTPTAPPEKPRCNPGDLTTTAACVCSGGRLFDNGGQCIVQCQSSETSDGFGGCLDRNGESISDGEDVVAIATVVVDSDGN